MADDQSQWDIVSSTPSPTGTVDTAGTSNQNQSQWDVVSSKPSPGTEEKKDEKPQAPAGPPTWAQRFGITNPVGKAAADVTEGVVAGGASSLYHAGDWIRRAAGMPRIINQPEVQAAMTSPPGLAGQIGKAGEQIGEFFLPSGLVGEGEKLAEGMTKLPGIVRAGAKLVPEALSAAGVTGAQTGGDPDAIWKAALLASGAKVALPILGKTAAAALGKSTGAGRGAIEAAAQGTPEVVNAMRGNTTEGEILQHLRDAMQAVKDQRGAAYRQQLANLPPASLDISSVQKGLQSALTDHGVIARVNPQTGQMTLDFSRSTISDPAAQGQVQNLVNDVHQWGGRLGDLTALGVDTLKRRIDDLYSPSSNARALIQRVKDQTRAVLNTQVPGYQKMTQDYAQASKFLDNIRDLSLESKNDGTAIRKFSTLLSQNNNYRRDLVQQLSQNSGRDLEAEIAGRALNSWTRRGIGGQALGAELAAGALSHFLPPGIGPVVAGGSLGTAILTSPRAVGEGARVAAKLAPFVPKVVSAVPSRIYVRPLAQYTMPDTQAKGGTIVDRWPGRKEQLRALTR